MTTSYNLPGATCPGCSQHVPACVCHPAEIPAGARRPNARKPAPTLAAVLAFLLGEAPLDGLTFGEPHPGRPPYWWRYQLREALRAAGGERDRPCTLTGHYKAQRDALLAFMQNADVSSGVCCCGDDMDTHGGEHSPVDQWSHSVGEWTEQIAAFNRLVAVPPAEPYSVQPTRCSCPPETCGCKPWTLKQGATTVTSFNDRDAAVETARRLNA